MSGTLYYDTYRGNKILLSDPHLQSYCREKCKCIDNEDKYLAEDWKETLKRKGLMAQAPTIHQVTRLAQPVRGQPQGQPQGHPKEPQAQRNFRPKNLPPCRGSAVQGKLQMCV